MDFDFEHLKKLCVCKRTTKGFDYGETHPNLGKCGVGQRWSGTRENIELAEKKYKALEAKLQVAVALIGKIKYEAYQCMPQESLLPLKIIQGMLEDVEAVKPYNIKAK